MAYDVGYVRSVDVILGIFRQIALLGRTLRAVDVWLHVSHLDVTMHRDGGRYLATPDCTCKTMCLGLCGQHCRTSDEGFLLDLWLFLGIWNTCMVIGSPFDTTDQDMSEVDGKRRCISLGTRHKRQSTKTVNEGS